MKRQRLYAIRYNQVVTNQMVRTKADSINDLLRQAAKYPGPIREMRESGPFSPYLS